MKVSKCRVARTAARAGDRSREEISDSTCRGNPAARNGRTLNPFPGAMNAPGQTNRKPVAAAFAHQLLKQFKTVGGQHRLQINPGPRSGNVEDIAQVAGAVRHQGRSREKPFQ